MRASRAASLALPPARWCGTFRAEGTGKPPGDDMTVTGVDEALTTGSRSFFIDARLVLDWLGS